MTNEQILKILLGELRDKLSRLEELIPRDAQFPDAPNKIKVVIGMRRVGKSYLLYQHILKLLKEGVPLSQILYVNFEDDRLLPLTQQKLVSLVEDFYALYPENHELKCYLFFDEIQNIEGWPTAIRRFHDTKQAEIFLTGSSAKMLSKEIATNLRGRSLALELWPYSFHEFMRAKRIKIDSSLFDTKTQDKLSHIFYTYLSEGGFPEVTHYSKDTRQQTLQDYLDVVIYRDIVERYLIKNPAVIKYMILTLIHCASKPFTINKLYNDLKSQGYSITKDSLYEYANYIEDVYLAFPVSLYDKSVRKVQTNPKKIYAIDTGMIRALTLDYESDLGRLFENVLYLDLLRQGYKVNYYLTQERFEVDFLVQTRQGQKKFFQAALNMDDPRTLSREKALKSAMKELKIDGKIITLDSYLQHGITIT